jgi:phage/plasmid-like protein (TIGR03299 family)
METEGNGAVAVLEPPARQLPWAGITTGTADDGELLSSAEMAARSGLNWEIGIRPYQRLVKPATHGADGALLTAAEYEPSARMFETYRVDTNDEVGAVKKRYQLLQNTEMFDFGDGLVEQGRGHWAEGGMQGNGYRVFMTMLLNDEFTVLGDDVFRMYLFLSGSHDGSRAVTVALTPIRVWCTNQTGIVAANNYGRYSISHVGDVTGKLTQASEAIRAAGDQSKLLQAQAVALAHLRLTDDKARNLLMSVIPASKPKREDLVEGIMTRHTTSPLVNGYEGTGWSLINALTEHMDHGLTRRSGNARYESITFGDGAKYRHRLTAALAELN